MKRLTIETATRGTIIQDDNDNDLYLILKHKKDKKALVCLDKKFNIVSIGTDWINHYYIYDTIDMDIFTNQILGIDL